MAVGKMQEVKADEWQEVESGSGNFWNPERIGDKIEGVVVDIKKDGKYGSVWVVRDMENKDFHTPSHKFLQNILAKISLGQVVRIVYHGEEPPRVRGENPMKKYKVFVRD